jgi:hypothetical protein
MLVRHREGHRHLAVLLLAQLATVLPGHADRELALLGQAGVVHDPGPDRAAPFKRRQRVAAHRCQESVIIPGRLGDKVVQRLVGRADPERLDPGRHRLDALALARQQKTGGVGPQRCPPVGVAEHRAQKIDVCPEALLPARHRPPIRCRRPMDHSTDTSL